MIAGDAEDESRLGLNSIKVSVGRPTHSAHLLDEAPLTEHCAYKLNTSEPWIVICDASTENPVKLRISILAHRLERTYLEDCWTGVV